MANIAHHEHHLSDTYFALSPVVERCAEELHECYATSAAGRSALVTGLDVRVEDPLESIFRPHKYFQHQPEPIDLKGQL